MKKRLLVLFTLIQEHGELKTTTIDLDEYNRQFPFPEVKGETFESFKETLTIGSGAIGYSPDTDKKLLDWISEFIEHVFLDNHYKSGGGL